jgi:hypothetical protein
MTVTKIDNSAKAIASIRALAAKRVLVGITSATAQREPDPDDPTPLNNAAIGYIQETGSPAKNIPARPFLVPGVKSIQKAEAQAYKAGLKGALKGGSLDDTHARVGLMAQSAVVEKISDGPFAPLSQATLAKRRAAGRNGEQPLINQGKLRGAITFAVVDIPEEKLK